MELLKIRQISVDDDRYDLYFMLAETHYDLLQNRFYSYWISNFVPTIIFCRIFLECKETAEK